MSTTIFLTAFAVACLILLIYRQRSRQTWQPTQPPEKTPQPTDDSRAVILPAKSGPYTLTHDWPRPRISPKEVLIRNKAIGLNPIDWKCVTYGFGVYSLPWVSGREAAGIIEEVGAEVQGFRKGDRVWVTSTNYRDNRTSTFQEVSYFHPRGTGSRKS